MAVKGVGITLEYVAWNTNTNQGQTGDVGNHTLRWVKDGVAAVPTNSPAEVDAANAPGVYKLALTATEMTCDSGLLAGKSSTTNVAIVPVGVTTEHGILPTGFPTNFPLMGIDAGGRVQLQSGITKNVALANFPFLMVLSDHVTAATGKAITAQRSIDGGNFGACANTAIEVGFGMYVINLAASDLNGTNITLRFSASGTDDRFVSLETTP